MHKKIEEDFRKEHPQRLTIENGKRIQWTWRIKKE
jgi:hypothetical protein